MKLQHLMIIFAIIFLPIILVTSYYIQRQVDTIDLQLSYDSKLEDATSDAMYAFEINTANEDLSTVADSLRSIIEASNNIFLNTLATNLGYSNASTAYIKPYIPAVLYTLYDGYYLYAPTASPEVLTDKYGQTVAVGDPGTTLASGTTSEGYLKYNFTQSGVSYAADSTTPDASTSSITGVTFSSLGSTHQSDYGQLLYKNKDGTYSTSLGTETYYSTDYILKSYVSYSAHYTHGSDIDINVNYTLDNFVTITGTVNDIYYSKSGYLIDTNKIEYIGYDANGDGTLESAEFDNIKWYTFSQDELVDLINSDTKVQIVLDVGGGNNITLNNQTSYSISGVEVATVGEDIRSAMEYYATSWAFSCWVNEYLYEVEAKDITNSWDFSSSTGSADLSSSTSDFMDSMIADFSGDTTAIFSFSSSNNPEDDESSFTNHKRSVIKNSIVYNLALALVNYGDMRAMESYDFPMFSGEEWDSILSNVSIVSFMQGFSCGLKTYNGYSIATSTNNEISVTTSEIYYVPIKSFSATNLRNNTTATVVTDLSDNWESTEETAHRIDCPGLDDAEYYISFTSKEIKYDKIYDKDTTSYVYDHKAYLAYDCIVNSNYTYTSTSGTLIRGLLTDMDTAISSGYVTSSNKIRAYLIAVAKERNNLYKPTEVSSSYGYEIDNTEHSITGSGYEIYITGDGNEIYKVELVMTDIQNTTSNVSTDVLTMDIGSTAGISTQTVAVSSTKSTTNQTFVFQDFNQVATGGSGAPIHFYFKNGSTGTIKSVKIYYK